MRCVMTSSCWDEIRLLESSLHGIWDGAGLDDIHWQRRRYWRPFQVILEPTLDGMGLTYRGMDRVLLTFI